MTRKILSLLLTLCMTLSLMTGITAIAEDTFALVNYDADSDFITLDFNQAVDTASAVISLEKDGKAVEFTFVSADYNQYVQANSSTYYTYLVKPTGGIDLDTEYKLTLAEIKNSDASATISGWSKYFIVKDLGGKLVDYRPEITSVSRVETPEGSGSYTLSSTTLNSTYSENYVSYLGTCVGEDAALTPVNHMDQTLSTYSVSNPVTEKDYTVKVTYSTQGVTKAHIGLAITDNVKRYFTADSAAFQGVYMHVQHQTATSANAYLTQKFSTTKTDYTQSKLDGGNRPTGMDITNTQFKLSTKNGVAHAYLDGKKIGDLALSRDYRGYVATEWEPLAFASGSTTATATVTGFLATRSTWTDETTIVPTPLLKSYDADTDFVTLNFDKEVNISSENVVLSKDGAVIPVTVASANHNNMKSANSTVYSYLVKPVSGGIETNKEYKLTLSGISDTDATETITSWAKAFTVAELAKGLKLPETDADKTMSYKSSDNYSVSNVNDDELMVQYNGTAVDAFYVYNAVGDDNNSTGSTFNEKDYTVKAVFKDVVNTPYANLGVAIASSKGYTFDHGQFRGTGMRMQVQPQKASDLSQGIGKYANMYIYSRTADANTTKNQGAADISDNDVASGVEVKLAVKESHVFGFINGKKIIDMDCYDAAGMAKLYFAPMSSDGAAVTIADFIVTRATWKNATPETKVALVDWDADSDFITLDFNEDVNITEENVTLTNAGTVVPVTVALANHANMEAANSERYTYLVKPVSGGIALDIPYTLNVSGITAKSADNSVFETFTKTFKVEKLAEGLQLIDGSKVMTYENRSVYNVANVNTDDIKADYTEVSTNRVQLYRAVGKDTDSTLINNFKDSPYTEKDYTVKTTFKNISGTTHGNLSLAIAYNYHANYGVNHSWFRGVSLYLQVQPQNGVIGNTTNMTVRNANDTTGAITKSQPSTIKGMDPVNGIELKLSTKNKFARAYINGGKVADMQLLQDYPGHAQIHFSPNNTTTDNLATVTIADFLATRAVEVTEELPEFAVGELTVTANGETVDSIAGKTKINVSTKLTNNTLLEKDVYITCALYAASGEMKNCVVSELKKAVSGNNPVNFNDVEVNGAEKIKVFIWDGVESLSSYFPALTFPEE
ncbi:MAG: hypothetical protein IJC74_03840 [Clostridia bacterium]|nr:hypothetical protein [Clostridia bacterium]